MKALRTLLPVILIPALFLGEINQIQAGSTLSDSGNYINDGSGNYVNEPADPFTFDRALWRNNKDVLVFTGTGTPRASVELFIAGTDVSLGAKTVNKRGRWYFKFYNPATIPCAVRAESSNQSLEKGVDGAPGDCVTNSEPPVENTPPVISGSPQAQVAEGQAYRFTPNASDADGDSLSFSIANRPSWASFNTASGELSGTPGYSAAGTTSNILISVSDGSATASLPAFNITVSDANRAPSISGTPSTNAAEGAGYSFVPQASDPDGDNLSFSIANKPSWASFSTSTGALSGTPGYDSAGTTSDIRISVSDGSASASLQAFNITVSDSNRAPSISGTPSTNAAEGAGYSFVPQASDPDGDNLSFAIANKPSWASFNTSTGALSGTPGYDSAGTTSDIRISVSDGRATASLGAFSITVGDTNRAPSISGTPVTGIDEGTAYSFTPSASDPDGDALTFSISNRPNWAVFDSNSGTLSGTPDADSAGTYSNIVISVSDGSEVASLGAFTITISDTLNLGGSFQFARAAYGVDEGSSVTLTVTRDNGAGQASVNYGTYGVEARNTLDYNGFEWTPLVFNDGETSKTITLVTLADDITESDETVGVHLDSPSDGYTLASPSISVVTIHDTTQANRAPVISGTPVTSIEEGTAYSFTPSASDPDGDALTFSISNRPNWAVFDSSNGALGGTPDANSAGTYSNIVISVSDGSEVASLGAFTITVTEPQVQGGSFQFAQAAYGVDEGSSVTLTVTRDNGAGQASVNYGTYGVEAQNTLDYIGFEWTPLVFNDGETSKTITLVTLADDITESDETLGVHLNSPSDGYTLASPSISVVTIHDAETPNSAPVISGTADQNATVGDEYSFTPSASDADNDTLSFSVTNLPAWASFNTQTGVLSGVPGSDDIGSYDNIVISVTDGTDSASLSPFSITVAAVEPTTTMGSVSLSWVPPTTRTDGSALDMSEISGYRIYMGTTADSLEEIVELADGSINDYVVDNILTGDYYFAVTTYDTDGNESEFSNIALKSAM